MPVKSLSLTIPDSPPYDRQGCWFESFIGNDIIPLVDTVPFKRFWFSRYGAVGTGKRAKFRFEVADLADVNAEIEGLRKKFADGSSEYADYDFATDIGEGQDSRFLGVNSRNGSRERRGDIAFNFLYGAACLFLDCLSGPDADGYFELEPKRAGDRFNVITPLEQFHHLFCNLSGAPTFIAIAAHPDLPGHHVMSFEEFKQQATRDNRWQLVSQVRVSF